jgi:hypothetical protein
MAMFKSHISGGKDMKQLLILISLLFVMTLAVGCTNSDNKENSISEKSTKIEAEEFKIYEDSFLAENFEVDIDGDGNQEIVKMYIHPAPIEDSKNKGQYLWDHSHLWQLIVFDKEKTYPLFNDNLSGKLKFWIEDNGLTKTIILLEDAMNLSFHTYVYNENGYFEKNTHYRGEGIPPIERSTTIK